MFKYGGLSMNNLDWNIQKRNWRKKSIMHDLGEICTLKRKLMGFFFQKHLMICSLWSTFFGPQNARFQELPDPLMVSWYFDPGVNFHLWYIDPPYWKLNPMVFWPPLISNQEIGRGSKSHDPLTHDGISTPLPMVYWPP